MRWRHASGRSTGTAHEKLGKPCQDRHAVLSAEADCALIAVLADGAGTAGLAHVGAEIAVETMRDVARLGVTSGRSDFEQILRDGAWLARQRLVEASVDRGVAPRDLACTLLAVIAAPLGGAAMQVGDGVIVVSERGPDWRWVFWPQKGEYANTTFFLSDERALADAAVCALSDDVGDVALMSDGLEALALQFAKREAHAPFFRSMFAPLHALAAPGEAADLSTGLTEFLASPAVRSRTDDDASLIIATRRELPAGT